jgi:hypothetical protein
LADYVTGWLILYFDSDRAIGGVFDHIEPGEIQDDLNSELGPVATLRLPNTNAYRDLCYNRQIYIEMFYDGTFQFAGMLLAGEAIGSKAQWIKAYCHDAVMTALDEAEPITGVYDEVPALNVLEEVIADVENIFGELNIDNCPTTPVTFVAFKANRLDIAKFLADSLGLELFSYGSNTINIGARGLHEHWPQRNDVTVGTHGFDKTKQATKVIIRGIDTFGHHITGEAALPYWVPITRVRTFNEDTPTNQDGLELLAAKKLIGLNSGFTGAPVKIRMPLAKDYTTGDYLYVYNSKYFLFGNQSRIVSMTKGKKQALIQLDKLPASVAKSIDELRSWEKKGIYLPGCTSWSINLQGLLGLWHINDGEGIVAHNSAPVDKPIDGTIVNGGWEDYANLKILDFLGSTYIDADQVADPPVDPHATNKFSIGGWFSPSSLDTTCRYLIHRDGQFSISYLISGGVPILQFTFTIGGGVNYFTFGEGKIKVGGRHFVMVTYDGTTLKCYLNTKMVASWILGWTIDASINKVYLGMFSLGILAEWMLWNRALIDQEVTELYFFPLTRCV